jgi:hypothetical protein
MRRGYVDLAQTLANQEREVNNGLLTLDSNVDIHSEKWEIYASHNVKPRANSQIRLSARTILQCLIERLQFWRVLGIFSRCAFISPRPPTKTNPFGCRHAERYGNRPATPSAIRDDTRGCAGQLGFAYRMFGPRDRLQIDKSWAS